MRYLTSIPITLRTPTGDVDLLPGDTFRPKSEEVIKPLLEEGKVRPVREILSEKYNQLAEWLHSHNLTGDEIQEALPELYEAIQRQIDRMDNSFYAEDLQSFIAASDAIRRLYQVAMSELKRKFPLKNKQHNVDNSLNIKYYYDLIATSF